LKAILFLAGGVLAVLLFLFFVRKFIATPENILFYSVSSKESVEEVLESLKGTLGERKIPLWTSMMDKGAIRILTCNTEGLTQILTKAPFFSLLLPCDVIIYQEDGVTKIKMIKEPIFIRYYTDRLEEREIRTIIKSFHDLRIAIGEAVR